MQWCREMLALSPFALRLVKASFNAARGRLRRHPAARPRREPPLLRLRRGPGGPRGLQGEAQARLLAVPAARRERRRPPDAGSGSWPRGRGRCPPAVAPVLVGTALAGHATATFRVGAFIAALLGALFIQVGTNLSNDYSDARRGADTEDRLGPVRVTAGGLVPPQQVLRGDLRRLRPRRALRRLPDRRRAAGSCSLIGVALDPRRRALHRRPAALRLRGPRRGLRLPLLRRRRRRRLLLRAGRALALGGVRARGARSACSPRAILVVNNVRDIDTDRRAGKRTLAVRLGRERDARAVRGDGLGAFLTAPLPWLARLARRPGCSCSLARAAARAARWSRTVRNHADGPTLNGALAGTGQLQLVFCVLLSAGILLS